MAGNKRRDKYRHAYWERMIERQRRSGMSIRAFCREHKLTETSFYFWRGELVRRRAEAAATRFVPVRLTAQEPSPEPPSPEQASLRPSLSEQTSSDQHRRSGRIEIELPRGYRIYLTPPVDAQSLGHVVAVLSVDHGLAQPEARRC